MSDLDAFIEILTFLAYLAGAVFWGAFWWCIIRGWTKP